MWKMNPFSGNLQYVPKTDIKNVLKDVWNNDVSLGGGGAVAVNEFDQNVFNFSQGLTQGLKARIKVPHDYKGGQLNALITVYAESIVDKFLLKTIATLIRVNDNLNLVTNQRTSTNTEVTNAAPQYKKQLIFCDLTDTTSKINGVAISANDIIDIYLYRDAATSDDANDIRVLPFVDIVKS